MFFSLYSWHEIFDKNIYFCTNVSHIQGNYDYKLKAQSHFISMLFANKFFDTHVDDIKHKCLFVKWYKYMYKANVCALHYPIPFTDI